MAFVKGMLSNDRCASAVRAIIAIANNFHMKVLAEGVETEEHAEILRTWGCNYAQGYYFGRPASERDTIANFARGIPQPA